MSAREEYYLTFLDIYSKKILNTSRPITICVVDPQKCLKYLKTLKRALRNILRHKFSLVFLITSFRGIACERRRISAAVACLHRKMFRRDKRQPEIRLRSQAIRGGSGVLDVAPNIFWYALFEVASKT